MKYTIRKSRESDAEKIVSLFVSQGQNPHGWSEEKWYHFYRDYPENKSFGFVAEKSGNIVGHYGVAECRIGPLRAAVGMHAFIDPAFRGLQLIRAILSEIETELSHRGVDILTAFSNKSFSLVKEKFLGWEYPFDLSFRKIAKLFKKDIDEKPFKFNFPSGWYNWRFGEVRDYYISRYIHENRPVPQLLKCPIAKEQKETCLPIECECFGVNSPIPRMNNSNGQPFLIKRLLPAAKKYDLSAGNQWYIEMGDSDTFTYSRWQF